MNFFKTAALTAFAATVVMLGSTSMQAQSKIGIVDMDVIVQQSPEFKDIQVKLANVKKKGEDSLASLEQEFKSKGEAYQKGQALMTPDMRASEEAKLNAIRENYGKFQQEWFGQTGVYAEFQKQLLQPVYTKVQAAIEKVSIAEKINAVMTKNMFAYFDKKLDITFKVLDYLRRDSK